MIHDKLRKFVVHLEKNGRQSKHFSTSSTHRITVAAVLDNPSAGQGIDDVTELYDLGAEAADFLVEQAIAYLEVDIGEIKSYGKSAIVGVDGKIEHAAALLHYLFDERVRTATQGEYAIPSTMKVGGPGSMVTIPLFGKISSVGIEQTDATEIMIHDAPLADEVVVILTLGIGGRPISGFPVAE